MADCIEMLLKPDVEDYDRVNVMLTSTNNNKRSED